MITITLFNSEGWKVQCNMPTEWNDFDAQEIKIISAALNHNGSKQELLLKVLEHRLQAQRLKLPKDWKALLSLDDVANDLLPLADIWLSANNLTRQPFPVIGRHAGPKGNFDDMLCGEYEDADYHFSLYAIHQDRQHLVDLAALLWRPVIGGRRISAKGYEADKSFFHSLDDATLHIVYLWFGGCRSALIELFPSVFEPPVDNDEEKQVEQEHSLGMVTRLIHSAAGERNGTREQIRWGTLIKELLYDCELQIEANEKMKQDLKRNG